MHHQKTLSIKNFHVQKFENGVSLHYRYTIKHKVWNEIPWFEYKLTLERFDFAGDEIWKDLEVCLWGRLIARSATSRLGLENWLKHWGRQHSRSHRKDGRTTSTKTAPRSRGSSQILHAGNLHTLRTIVMLGIQDNSWGLSQAGHWTDNLVKRPSAQLACGLEDILENYPVCIQSIKNYHFYKIHLSMATTEKTQNITIVDKVTFFRLFSLSSFVWLALFVAFVAFEFFCWLSEVEVALARSLTQVKLYWEVTNVQTYTWNSRTRDWTKLLTNTIN